MSKDLIIVESPAKVKTIGKFLGKDYAVEASVGHVRDLPKGDMGLDEAHGYAPRYEIIKGKEEVVGRLRKAARSAAKVYLAPDPDREGEAIAWHVAELIKGDNKNLSRIRFNEITSRAVHEALNHPQEINADLVGAQQARRVLDRLVGYKLSPILWKSVKRGISAGRVQSVALRLVVDRERERRAFRPVEYWSLRARLEGETPPPFRADLWKVSGRLAQPGLAAIGDAKAAEELVASVKAGTFAVKSVDEKERAKSAPPPFTTSSLQQMANRALGYPAKKTMGAAQKLYEGVDLGEGTVALITYMRTDSVRIADEAKKAARAFILERYGQEFVPAKPKNFKGKAGAQDAHEACRPVDVTLTPEALKGKLPADLFKLYQLIWRRFVASQMTDARFHDTTVVSENGKTLWRARGERLLFPGFLKAQGVEAPEPDAGQDAAGEAEGAAQLPPLAPGDALRLLDLSSEQKFTQPPPRYTEATLVKALEEQGIGRPSTYAAIIGTLQGRDYVTMEERRFAPTELGSVVSDQLVEHFATLMDVGFTAGLEQKLDEIAAGKRAWPEVIAEFMAGFAPELAKAGAEMKRTAVATDIVCPNCGKPMVVKFGKTGEFLGCSGYPECKTVMEFTRDEHGRIIPKEKPKEEITDIVCELCGKPMAVKIPHRGRSREPFLGCTGYPKCKNIKNFRRTEDGKIEIVEKPKEEPAGTCPECGKPMVVKMSRSGSRFIGCTGYPACRHTEPYSIGIPCPMPGCDGQLVEKSSRRGKVFYSCSRYPKCKFSLWDRPVPGPCPKCGFPLLVEKRAKNGDVVIACPNKDCDYVREGE